MNDFQGFIFEHGSQLQLLLFSGLFAVSWNIENITGGICNYKKWKHAFINAPFIFTSIPGVLLLGFLFTKTIEWTTHHQFGFLYLLPVHKSSLLLFLVTFILLDLGEYIYHVIMHKVKTLWMFHVVHHSDKVVDVSTTLREHPAENLIRLSFTLLWVFLSGAVFWVLMLRQIIQAFTTIFAHINYRLPYRTDHIISMLFITPNLHQVHHHYKQPYTDCNYGDVLSIWDRIFGTFKRLPPEDLIFGLDTYAKNEATCKFMSLIKLPFGKFEKVED
jgi:sterol desaturase/sphingolipid hydroxylase (fatty acid hydroxylase superfamily)